MQSSDRGRPGPPSWRFIQQDNRDTDADDDTAGDQLESAWEDQRGRVNTRRLKTEEVNLRLQEQWAASFNDNAFRFTCHEAQHEQSNAALQASLAESFLSAAKGAIPVCPACSIVHSESNFQTLQCASTEQLLYVTIHGRAAVSHPVFRCAACGDQRVAHPVSFGCFPATPTEPQVVYDRSLLYLTCKVSQTGPLAMEAWCKSLEALHQYSGCAPEATPTNPGSSDGHKVWRNLGMAAQQWQRVADSVHNLDRYGVSHIAAQPEQPTAHHDDMPGGADELDAGQHGEAEEGQMEMAADDARLTMEFNGPMRQCPCCWRTCQAAMADACMGITHLRAAGCSADMIQPLQPQTPFV
ncbi:MAG: hypothetical protein ACRDL7_12535, partial [Gaiellaceae bacterium]